MKELIHKAMGNLVKVKMLSLCRIARDSEITWVSFKNMLFRTAQIRIQVILKGLHTGPRWEPATVHGGTFSPEYKILLV